MRTYLNWLHISDIHFHAKTEWRDSHVRISLLNFLKEELGKNETLKPDLIFCTGDIAFGEADADSLDEQYAKSIVFFEELRAACGRNGTSLPKERLFVVPGNHDINRKSIDAAVQSKLHTWAKDAHRNSETINQQFNDKRYEVGIALARLAEYDRFVKNYLPHHYDEDGRCRYAHIVDIDGLKVAIAGFNSAWSCAGPEDDRHLWMAAEWQFYSAKDKISDGAIRIGLMHHAVDWLNEEERDVTKRQIVNKYHPYHFWLHGHVHNVWIEPGQINITIAAGATNAQKSDEFGINLVRLDLANSKGNAHLFCYSRKNDGWTYMLDPNQAPHGVCMFDVPLGLKKLSASALTASAKRNPRLFGREALLKRVSDELQLQSFLLIYGLRGNGKSSLIEALGRQSPLVDKEHVRFLVTPATTVDDFFQRFAALLGDTSEFPKTPKGDSSVVAEEIKRRYPNPRPAWVWIDRAHHLMDSAGFRSLEVRALLRGLQLALGSQWHWVFELRERPPRGLLGADACECEVPGLNKIALSECLDHAAPTGKEVAWHYTGQELKGIYQWLGGGHGRQAQPQAIQLLIEVARGLDETPLQTLERHRSDFEQKIEDVLLGDLYGNVLNAEEQRLLQTLSLYRNSIPHDHAEVLERQLSIPGSWDGLDRRCLLTANDDHSQYYLHSLISIWIRTRMGYVGQEDGDPAFESSTPERDQKHARGLHAVIATCWLDQLRGSRRATNLNIDRALEAFYHLTAAGEADRIQSIATDLLTGNKVWAIRRIENLYTYLYKSKAPLAQLRAALEYAEILEPDNDKVQRFLGECWRKAEGWKSPKALGYFEQACRLNPSFPPYWANLGKALLAQGRDGANQFIDNFAALETETPAAINDYVRSVYFDCLHALGNSKLASKLRLERIDAGSNHPAFYVDEAKARLKARDPKGALEILDLAQKSSAVDHFTEVVRAEALQCSGKRDQASALRMAKIQAGTRHTTFYMEEAKSCLEVNDPKGALKILDLAVKNGLADEKVYTLRSTAMYLDWKFEQSTVRRMERKQAGIREADSYGVEAKECLRTGDAKGALDVLDLAEKNGCVDDFLVSIRATALDQLGKADEASALRMGKIKAGSRDPIFHNDEAKAQLRHGNVNKAIDIFERAVKKGCTDEYSYAILANALHKSGKLDKATAIRMDHIAAGSSNPAFYADEAKTRIEMNDQKGALYILNLAEKNGCANEYIVTLRAKLLRDGITSE